MLGILRGHIENSSFTRSKTPPQRLFSWSHRTVCLCDVMSRSLLNCGDQLMDDHLITTIHSLIFRISIPGSHAACGSWKLNVTGSERASLSCCVYSILWKCHLLSRKPAVLSSWFESPRFQLEHLCFEWETERGCRGNFTKHPSKDFDLREEITGKKSDRNDCWSSCID